MVDFPDVNVWVALSTSDHEGHKAAKRYFEQGGTEAFIFCWASGMGLVRVTSQKHTFGGSPLSPHVAWANFQQWLERPDVDIWPEPDGLANCISDWVSNGLATARNWTDLYLAAFAYGYGLRLVTFDSAFQRFPDLDLLVLKP